MNFLLSNVPSDTTSFLGNLKFTTEHLSESLKIMAIGMGGIFAALIIIYIFSVVLQKIFPQKK